MANLVQLAQAHCCFQLVSMDKWEGLAFALDSMTCTVCTGKEAPYLRKAYYLWSIRLIISSIVMQCRMLNWFSIYHRAAVTNDLDQH